MGDDRVSFVVAVSPLRLMLHGPGRWDISAAPIIDGGGCAVVVTLPGFDARYLTRLPGSEIPGEISNALTQSQRPAGRPVGIAMRFIPSRAPGQSTARSDLLERQLKRYALPVQRPVRGLAARHE